MWDNQTDYVTVLKKRTAVMGMERTEAQTERWDLNSSLFIHTGCTICTGGGGGTHQGFEGPQGLENTKPSHSLRSSST